MNCPDCSFTLKGDATKCRCGWVKPAAHQAAAAIERSFCATTGCEQRAQHGFQHCQACAERIRHEEAAAACRARGLNSVDEMRAYCRRLAKTVYCARPSFERWAENITQGTVERLVLMGGKDDVRMLERLRNMAVIDERNRVVPVADRAARRAALAEHRNAEASA